MAKRAIQKWTKKTMGFCSPSSLKREKENCYFIAGDLSRCVTETTPRVCGRLGKDGKKDFSF